MKPKQKHKRGAERYSLDIYTPLTRDECIDRLREGKKAYPQVRIYVRGTKLKVRLRRRKMNIFPPYYPILPCYFQGQFEPHAAGMHIYGELYRMNIPVRRVDFIREIIFLFGSTTLVLMTLSKLTNIVCMSVLLIGVFAAGSIAVVISRARNNPPRYTKRLLTWIDEQLNIEAADETQTQA